MLSRVVAIFFISLFFLCCLFFPHSGYAQKKLMLEDLILKAEQNHHKLKSLEYRLSAREYQIAQSVAKYKPSLSLLTYYGWQKYESAYTRQEISQSLKFYRFSVTQPIYRPDILVEIRQNKEYKEIDAMNLELERQYLRYFILNQIFNLAYAVSQEELYLEYRDLSRKKYSLALFLKDKNLLSEEEVIEAQKELTDILLSLKEIEIEKEMYAKILRMFLDQSSFAFYPSLNTEVKDWPKLEVDFLHWKSRLKHNLEVKIAQKRLEIARLETKRRVYERFPKLDLELSYQYASSSAISTASHDQRVLLVLEFPIYRGGYFSARKAEALELEKVYFEEKQQIEKEKAIQLEESWRRFYSALKRVEKIKKKLTYDHFLLETINEAYQRGLKSKWDVIQARISWIHDRLDLNESFKNLIVSYVELLYLTSDLSFQQIGRFNAFLNLD